MSGNELDFHPYRPAEPPWWPGDESGYEEYHRQLFTLDATSSGFARWKVFSTGVNIARQLAGARNAGRADWMARHGVDPGSWPLQHPPVILWIPKMAYAACVRCRCLGASTSERSSAASAARRHAAAGLSAGDPALLLLLDPVPVYRHPAAPDDPAMKAE